LPRPLSGRFDLGARIKEVRKKQGLSQKELAEKTGVTPSSISQVEKNLIYPSIPALFRMAESLSVEVASFFEGIAAVENGCVYRGAEGVGASFDRMPKGAIEGVQLLPPDMKDTGIEPFLVKIEPGRKLVSHFFSHKGEEMGYLLAGKLTVRVKGQFQEVEAGDVVYLKKDIPEQWENTGEAAAELLWIKIK
jgi:transcriptional regulator with XRE-family HTH domain